MGGIAGVWYLDGRPATREIAGRLEEALRHRGPDAGGWWADGSVALAQRLLWTTPQSLSEHGPHTSTDECVVLCTDLRIDNRGELLDACDVRGPERATIGDVELLLRAYSLWGDRCPEKLTGDFAFAIWDARRELLFCARDHVGVKPFFYHHTPGRVFVFASEIKGVLAVHEVPRRLNEARVIDYIERSFDDKTVTFYTDILRLPPGHSLNVTRDGARISQYWSLDPTRELRLGAKEYAPAFRELFVEAVRCRLRSAFPVGGMLSGGLDSSSIVCVARNLAAAAEPKIALHSFSAVFDETPECDERPYIETVTAAGGLQAHFIRADQVGPMDDLDRILWEQDEPFFVPNLFMHRALYAAARKAGVRVLLDGFDGDTAVSHGVKYLTELGARGHWLTLAREIGWLAWRTDRSPSSLLRKHVLSPLTPERIRRYAMAGRRRRAPSRSPHPILSRSFTERAAWSDRMGAAGASAARVLRTEREAHFRKLTLGLIPLTLEVADRASAGFGLEARYPFFDRRILEFCLALPGEQKLHNGYTRMILRTAMAGILPEKIRWRGGKSNLAPNFDRGMASFDEKVLTSLLLADSPRLAKYLDAIALREAHERFRFTGVSADALTIWLAATLAWWLRSTEPATQTQPQLRDTSNAHG